MKNRGILKYPAHVFKPEDFMGFTELKPFSVLWSRLNLTDEDLLTIQIAIICNPDGHPIISGTGGVRKLRFAPKGDAAGKSGGMRCLYKFFPEHHRVILALVYPKNVKEDISPEDKKRIRKAIQEFEDELNKDT